MVDFSDLGGVPIQSTGTGQEIDFSDLGGQRISQSDIPGESGELSKFAGFQATPLTPRQLYEKTGAYWPMIGAIGGSSLGPAGTAGGAGLGQIARNATGIIFNDPNAPRTALAAAKPAMAQAGLAPLLETEIPFTGGQTPIGAVTDTLQGIAQGAGRRALGYTKRFLRKPGQLASANDAAQVMLDKGIISPLHGTESTLAGAENLADEYGPQIGDFLKSLDATGIKSIDPNAVGVEAMNQLASPYKGGIYDTQNAIAKEIADTIGAHGNEPMTFQSAQDLKGTLQDIGNKMTGTDNMRSYMYKRAGGIVNDAMEQSIAQGASPEALTQYQGLKKIYGASQNVQPALLNKLSSEEGNNLIGLREAIPAGVMLAGANPIGAAKSLGILEVLERRGLSGLAKLADTMAKNNVPMPVRQAILSGIANSLQPQESGQASPQ